MICIGKTKCTNEKGVLVITMQRRYYNSVCHPVKIHFTKIILPFAGEAFRSWYTLSTEWKSFAVSSCFFSYYCSGLTLQTVTALRARRFPYPLIPTSKGIFLLLVMFSRIWALFGIGSNVPTSVWRIVSVSRLTLTTSTRLQTASWTMPTLRWNQKHWEKRKAWTITN